MSARVCQPKITWREVCKPQPVVLDRLQLEPVDRDTVTFLIASHLLMSATTRRQNILRPQVVGEFQ